MYRHGEISVYSVSVQCLIEIAKGNANALPFFVPIRTKMAIDGFRLKFKSPKTPYHSLTPSGEKYRLDKPTVKQ